MNTKQTMTAIGAALAVLAAAAGLAAPWYSSQRMESELRALVTESAKGDVVMRNLDHQAGWMASSGSLDIVLHGACAQAAGAEPVAVHVKYAAKHWLSPQGLGRFTWSATPKGAVGESAARFWGKDAKLTGEGVVTYGGLIKTAMALPALESPSEGGTMQVTPSTGNLVAGAGKFQLDWAVDHVAVRGRGEAIEAKQLSLALDLRDRLLGTGTMTLRAESIATGTMTLEGLSVSSETREEGDRLSAQVTESVRSAQFLGQSLKDMTLEATVNGLHSKSVLTLSKAISDTCGLQNMTAADSQQVRDAVKTLLASGLGFGINKLHGSGNQGSVDGKLLVTLAPAQGETISLARQLSASGHIAVQGDMVTAEQKQVAMGSGFVQPVDGGLKASFEYDAGSLKVSGKALDAGMLQLFLGKADDFINAYLAGKPLPGSEAEEAVANPPEAEAPASVVVEPAPKG